MTDTSPRRFTWGWPAASRVCALVAVLCFGGLLLGGHLGSINLEYLGFFFLALAFVL